MDTELDYEKFIQNQWIHNSELSDHYLYREGVFAAYFSFSANYQRMVWKAGVRMENTRLRPHSYIRPEESVKQNYTDFFPSASILYHLNTQKKHMLTAAYTRKISRPGFNELNPYRVPMNNYAYVIGNPNLKPAYSDNLSFTAILHNVYPASVGYNQTKGSVNQLIFTDKDDEEILYYQFANMDRSRSFYLSVNAPYKFFAWWNSSTNLNVGYSINKEKEETFRGAYFMGRMNNSFVLPEKWFLEANFMYYSDGVMSIWKMKSYNMLDLLVKKVFFNNRLIATVSVNNILDSGKAIIKASTNQEEFYKRFGQRTGNMMRTYRFSLLYNFKVGKDIKVKKVQTGNSEERDR
ncbi:MAG: outer membrane beta-barrel family protein [Rikenellaceae bacterium]|nr:outer membrane beta-barrel family protein [Rikenellaceae bacterium]